MQTWYLNHPPQRAGYSIIHRTNISSNQQFRDDIGEVGVWPPKLKFGVMAGDDVREMVGVIGQYDTLGKYGGWWWGKSSVRLRPQMDRESRGYGELFSNDLRPIQVADIWVISV